jgi:hypothetical protein
MISLKTFCDNTESWSWMYAIPISDTPLLTLVTSFGVHLVNQEPVRMHNSLSTSTVFEGWTTKGTVASPSIAHASEGDSASRDGQMIQKFAVAIVFQSDQFIKPFHE